MKHANNEDRSILSGVVANLSGFAAVERDVIYDLVHAFGGEVRRNLSKGVTHLIAKTLRGEKVRRIMMTTRDKPPRLVSSHWLADVIERKIDLDNDVRFDPRHVLCGQQSEPTGDVVVEDFGDQVCALHLCRQVQCFPSVHNSHDVCRCSRECASRLGRYELRNLTTSRPRSLRCAPEPAGRLLPRISDTQYLCISAHTLTSGYLCILQLLHSSLLHAMFLLLATL